MDPCWMQSNHLKGASPVPGPTMMMGVDRSLGSLKSGFLATYTATSSPTYTTDCKWSYLSRTLIQGGRR